MKPIVFKDRVKVQISAGNGGDGAATFRREKYVPRGGPSGGDGGRGGHVIFRASKDQDSLLPLYFRPLQRAEHGGRGLSKEMHGRNGPDLVIPVPCGTVISLHDSKAILGEVVNDGDEFLAARGGRGGLGNVHFKTSSHRAPTEFTHGESGEERTLTLELKMVADVGLVGYPNAGKSTLLRALSAAHPKTAAYPFTTLHPMIGTLIAENYRRIRVADIPGLIDGAHAGVGLGHDFLRHIERTLFLVFVIDMGGVDGRNPTQDFLNLREELRKYDPALDERPYLVVANKMDVPGSTEHLEAFRRETGEDPLELCAELCEGTDTLKQRLLDELTKEPPRAEPTAPGEDTTVDA